MEIEIPKMVCARCDREGPPWEFMGELNEWPYRECPACGSVDVRVVIERLALGVSAPSQD